MSPRTRYSIQELSTNPLLRLELDKVIKAFAGIQALPPSDPNSFYFLSGFHGEPFRGPAARYPGPTNDDDEKKNMAQTLWWGGYCNHGNVLFPTWHRAYMQRFEKALQSIQGCSDVMLPFWDEGLEMGHWNPYHPQNQDEPPTVPEVVPKILTDEYIMIDNKRCKNPLFSYTLQKDTSFVSDSMKNSRFSKPKGYETCRFPRRGVVYDSAEKEKSKVWNEQCAVSDQSNAAVLNANVAQWLEGAINININVPGPDASPTPIPPDTSSIYSRFQMCLEAPNYTVFSNTTSQNQWVTDMNSEENNQRACVMSLESPHNSIHLAVGGFFNPGKYNANPEGYQQASGDMGDNETASFDPIFYLHHAFIDYAFWTWQKRHNFTKRGDLDVVEDYPGTITDEGSPVGLAPGTMLDMDTPLYPFRMKKGNKKEWVTSHDVTDIHELGYDYGKGSLDPFVDSYKPKVRTFASMAQECPKVDSKIVSFKRTHGINRGEIPGSFVMRTVARRGDKTIEVAREAILSRLNVRACVNCQTHLEAESLFPLYKSVVDALGATGEEEIEYEVLLDTHGSQYLVHLNTPLSESRPLLEGSESDGELRNAMSAAHVETI